jgi:hypothetical protein
MSEGLAGPAPPPVRFGTTPFIPPPPSCAARRLQDAGSTTAKLIGFAVLPVSIGAIEPLTRQCAGTSVEASTQDGGDSVTLLTGAPIADTATDVPTFSGVQSGAAMVTSAARRDGVDADGAGACAPAGAATFQASAAANAA